MPHGIGKLTNLRSLATFNIGMDPLLHCRIEELKDMVHLKGSLVISGLINVRSGIDAKESHMRSKDHINTLFLQWSDGMIFYEGDEGTEIAEEVLESLYPTDNLKEIIIRDYPGNSFPMWVECSHFCRLVSVIFDHCYNCQRLPYLGRLPSLKFLSIQKMYSVQTLNLSESEYDPENCTKYPSLEQLTIWEMYELVNWVEIGNQDFPALQSLRINSCPFLKNIPRFPALVELSVYSCAQFLEAMNLQSLQSLRIEDLQKTKYFKLSKDLVRLKKLEISHCPELILIVGLSALSSLETFIIFRCPQLVSRNILDGRLFIFEERDNTRVWLRKAKLSLAFSDERVNHPIVLNEREVNSDKLTPAPRSTRRSRWTGQSTKALSFSRQTGKWLTSATKALSRTSSSSNIQSTKRETNEELQKKKQEKDPLRRHIEEIENEEKEEINEVMFENDLLKSQGDEYSKQIQVANKMKLGLEKQVSNFEQANMDLQKYLASAGKHNEPFQEKTDYLATKTEELCLQMGKMPSISSTVLKHCEFSWKELQQATQNFSESLKIGEGGFGSVYKGYLRQTTVAIKLLRSESLQGISEFQQEVAILTKVKHPNIVSLIGVCSSVSALVYEYLSHGSLADHLACFNHTMPLSWQTRTRIIGEIGLALTYLHSKCIVHGDVKPENILLDANLVSKLSDFGISRLLKQLDNNSTAYHITNNPRGTFPYMEPEYLSTGILTPSYDIYSFGIIILQLLTGRSPRNIKQYVQEAMENGILQRVIDKSAGSWPFDQAEVLVEIGLRCIEPSRRNRPDLVREVLAVIEPLIKSASAYVEPLAQECTPSHFVCPIQQDVMRDPHITADGFTYEADAITQWLESGHNTSPMTNLPLTNRNLIPNRVLRSAIQEWRQKHPQS